MVNFKSIALEKRAMSQKLERYWHIPFIILAVILGLYFRIVNPWNSVFVPWIEGARLSGNDPWYYFRLIDSTIHNFPNRIWFDAFTKYPYGTYLHFGPFLVYLSAIVSMIAGATTPEQIRSVIVFIPAIAGSLLAFPAYLLVKEIFGKKAGVIASLLIVMIPGQLMARSVLSFNDHHIWETFWQLSTLALFVASINAWKGDEIKNLKDKKLIYPVLTGIAFGLYLDTWAPGFIVGLMILLYTFFVYLFKKWMNVDLKSLTLINIISFGVAAILYLPFAFIYPKLSTTHYSVFQLIVILGAIFISAIFYLIYKLEKRGFYSKIGIKEDYAFPATIIIISAFVIIGIASISPDLMTQLGKIVRVIQPKGGALTIAEVQPFFTMGGKFSLAPAWDNFSMTFFFAILGIIYVLYRLFKERESIYLLLLIWGIAMLIALTGQNRFAYYFGAVSAIFAAIITDAVLRKLRFYEYIRAGLEDNKKEMKKIGNARFVTGILILLILFYPTFNSANIQSKYSAGGVNKQWYEALSWMRENTPGKEIYDEFYYQLYKPSDAKPYPYYPQGVYGVISWWDYGHWITAIAHRIPIANPFQQGIGNKYNNIPGAAPFFTAFNETYANSIADELGVKYVVSDVEMATTKFYAMATWAEGDIDKPWQIYYAGVGRVYQDMKGRIGISLTELLPPNVRPIMRITIPSLNYYKTMEAKFHIFDGRGLKHYRMVYESESSRGSLSGAYEFLYRVVYNKFHSKELGYKIDEMSTGYVKIFEYVKGAEITGKAKEDVVAKVKIETNHGRVFEYVQKAKVENGTYKLILPYAQNTTYPVKPIEDYTIISGNITKRISLSDDDVENGRKIVLDLI